MTARTPAVALALVCVGGCASALREPPPVAAIGLPAVAETNRAGDVDALLAEADDAFAGRPDPVRVVRAQELFMAAARADDRRAEGLLGAMRATAWLVEHEADGGRREALVLEGVQLGQWCGRRAPAEVSAA